MTRRRLQYILTSSRIKCQVRLLIRKASPAVSNQERLYVYTIFKASFPSLIYKHIDIEIKGHYDL